MHDAVGQQAHISIRPEEAAMWAIACRKRACRQIAQFLLGRSTFTPKGAQVPRAGSVASWGNSVFPLVLWMPPSVWRVRLHETLFLLSAQRFANWGRGSGAGNDLANSLGGETDGDTVGAVGDADGA